MICLLIIFFIFIYIHFLLLDEVLDKHVTPICNTQPTIVAALDLLVALAGNCVPNLRVLSDCLTELYYSGHDVALTEWEYQPPIGPRPLNGFVGLKNAGATCYMNSVLQQVNHILSLYFSLQKNHACFYCLIIS